MKAQPLAHLINLAGGPERWRSYSLRSLGRTFGRRGLAADALIKAQRGIKCRSRLIRKVADGDGEQGARTRRDGARLGQGMPSTFHMAGCAPISSQMRPLPSGV